MANIRMTDKQTVTPTGSDFMLINQAGSDKNTTLARLKTYMNGSTTLETVAQDTNSAINEVNTKATDASTGINGIKNTIGSGNLETTSQNIIGAVNEVNTKVGNEKLETVAENATGAINELNQKIGNVDIENDGDIAAQLNEKANNWLKGKTLNFVGDSCTVYSKAPAYLAENLKCTCNDYGISGTLISQDGGMCERVLSINTSADVNIVWGGTNDWSTKVSLGSPTDTTNATFYGAMNLLCTNLMNTCPNAINVIMTPLKRNNGNVNTNYPLEKIVSIMAEVANKYNCLVIDLYNDAPNFNPFISTLKTRWSRNADGLHPSEAYAKALLNPLIEKRLLSLTSSSIEKNIADITEKTIYVDSVNGLDSNNGEQATPFATLQKAINSIPFELSKYYTIKLLSDITLSSTLTIDRELTLDLNNKTITGNINTSSAKLQRFKLNVLIKNGTITGNVTSYANLFVSAVTVTGNVVLNGADLCNATYIYNSNINVSSGYCITATETAQVFLNTVTLSGETGLLCRYQSDIRKVSVTNNCTTGEVTNTGGVIR